MSAAQSLTVGEKGSMDLQILQAVLDGQPDAWRVLTRRFAPLLRTVIRHTLRSLGAPADPTVVDDVLQECYLRMLVRDHSRLRRYAVGANTSVSTWLAVITRSCTRDFVRSWRRGRCEHWSSDALVELSASTPTPEDEADDQSRRRVLLRLVLKLPPREREFAMQYFIEGLAGEVVAANQDISIKTTYSRSSKILHRLERAGLDSDA